MARGLPAVLHVQTVAGGRDQLLRAGREYLLQNGLLSVSEWEITKRERGSLVTNKSSVSLGVTGNGGVVSSSYWVTLIKIISGGN